MKFRPCIDIHNGKVKQIIGSTLKDKGDYASENFVSEEGADYYAALYKKHNLKGGHIILLNSSESPYYEDSKKQAFMALSEFKNGMQVGGGINDKNAMEFIEAGASHVIVTSFVFREGTVNYDNLRRISSCVGTDRLVLDLSCRKRNGNYYVVTDRWQTFTEEEVNERLLDRLADYCDEFLIHGVDVEGKNAGIDKELVKLLGKWNGIPMTYAGGIKSLEDIEKLKEYSEGGMDFTIGSALDIFGGNLSFNNIVKKVRNLSNYAKLTKKKRKI